MGSPWAFLARQFFNGVNPKGWLVAVGAVGTYLQTVTDNAFSQAVTFGALFFAVAFPCGLVWLVLGAVARRLLQDERSARIFNIVMGIALAASVAMMFL